MTKTPSGRQIPVWLVVAGAVLLVVCLVGVFGCSDRTPEQANPAPSSSLTKADAIAWAFKHWDGTAAGRTHCGVLPTGSMLPVFGSTSVLLLEPATQPRVGDLLLYDAANYSHRVKEVRDGHVLMDGDNNDHSDGWVELSRVHHRVAGILYAR